MLTSNSCGGLRPSGPKRALGGSGQLLTILWFSKHRPSGPMLSISRFVHMCVCLSVCLISFEVPFKRLFAPTSRYRMFKIVRDSESLGKSNGKKWSQIWNFLLMMGVKSPRKEKVSFWANFALLSRIFLVLVFLTPFNGIFAPFSWSPMSKLFRLLESLGKSNEKKWSQI